SEVEAFRTFGRLFGERAALLVDTYDSRRGIDRAVAVIAEGIPVGALRLDSGDLDALARYARSALDEAGLRDVRILAGGGLGGRQGPVGARPLSRRPQRGLVEVDRGGGRPHCLTSHSTTAPRWWWSTSRTTSPTPPADCTCTAARPW